MNSVSADRVGEELRAVIRESRSGWLLGAQIVPLLKERLPDFRPQAFGFAKFTDLVRELFPDVFVRPTNGGDVSFSLQKDGLGGVESTRNAGTRLYGVKLEHEVLRAFASPNTKLRLFVDPAQKVLQLSDEIRPEGNGRIPIPSCTAEELKRFAIEFATRQGDEARASLMDDLDQQGWWLRQKDTLFKFGLLGAHYQDRSNWLRERLKQAVSAAGVELDQLKFEDRRDSSRKSMESDPVQFEQRTSRSSASPNRDDPRRFAIRLIEHLPIDEIRAIRVPLGHFLDTLESLEKAD